MKHLPSSFQNLKGFERILNCKNLIFNELCQFNFHNHFALTILFSLFFAQLKAQHNGIINQTPVSSRLICDVVGSFPVKDTWPTGIAFDGKAFWSGGSNIAFIYLYDAMGTITDSIPSPVPTTDFCVAELVYDKGYLWACSEETDKIFKLNIETGAVVHQLNLAANTNIWGMTLVNEHIFLSYYLDGFIVKIDTSTGQILNTLWTPKPIISMEYIQGSLYGLSTDYSHLYKIDTQTGDFLDSVEWCIPYPLGLTYDGRYIWNISSAINFGGDQKAYQIDLEDFLSPTHEIPAIQAINMSISPNPVSRFGNLKFNTSAYAPVNIDLYELGGRKVRRLFSAELAPGQHSIPFNTNGLASGIYLVQLIGKGETGVCKMVVR
jgi:hypothetical protein